MNKNILKIVGIVIIFIILCLNMQTNVYADWISDASDFSSEGSTSSSDVITMDTGKVKNVSNVVSGILLGISVIVAVITTAVLGINFIVQSAEEKAKVKEALVPLIIGMIISFGAYAIWKFAIRIFM